MGCWIGLGGSGSTRRSFPDIELSRIEELATGAYSRSLLAVDLSFDSHPMFGIRFNLDQNRLKKQLRDGESEWADTARRCSTLLNTALRCSALLDTPQGLPRCTGAEPSVQGKRRDEAPFGRRAPTRFPFS